MGQGVIIFGATGVVGKKLVYELLEDSRIDKVLVVVRRKLPLGSPKLEQLVLTDFTKLEDVKQQLLGDVYYCCIGTTINKAGTQEAFKKIDYDIPVAIAQIANANHIPNLVIVSSISANAGSSNFYLRTKGEMEQRVISIYNGNLKIVRPSMILGHRDEFRLGEKIGKAIMTVLGIFMLGPLTKYRGIQACDIARGMKFSVDLPKEKVIIESNELFKLAVQGKKSKNRPSGMI